MASLGRLYDPSIEGVFLFFFNVSLFSHDLLIDYYSVLNVHVSIKQFLQFPIPIWGGVEKNFRIMEKNRVMNICKNCFKSLILFSYR